MAGVDTLTSIRPATLDDWGKAEADGHAGAGDFPRQTCLSLAAALERGSDILGPEAIVRRGESGRRQRRQEATDFEAVTGKGVRGRALADAQSPSAMPRDDARK